MAAQYVPTWAKSVRQGGLGVDNLIEVNRFAFGGKQAARQPRNWRQYIDGGLAGWWYYRAPGSGIFYRTGATRLAATKPAMLALLVREWAASSALNTSEVLMKTLRTSMGKSRHVQALLGKSQQQPLTPGAAADFFALQQQDSTKPFRLSDGWDVLIIRLGRALGYDTLVFTTEVDSINKHVTSSLVDLRSPFASEYFNRRVDLLERNPTSPSLTVPAGAKVLDEDTARAWAEHVARHSLCLADPFADGPRCTRPCNFTKGLHVRLACPGHISWALRNEPHPGCYKY